MIPILRKVLTDTSEIFDNLKHLESPLNKIICKLEPTVNIIGSIYTGFQDHKNHEKTVYFWSASSFDHVLFLNVPFRSTPYLKSVISGNASG